MDFGLSDDQRLFCDALRRYLADHVPVERVRTVMESEDGRDDELREGLAGQGVCGVLIDEQTYKDSRGDTKIKMEPLPPIAVKGRDDKMVVFRPHKPRREERDHGVVGSSGGGSAAERGSSGASHRCAAKGT